jgi:hypothetical protein
MDETEKAGNSERNVNLALCTNVLMPCKRTEYVGLGGVLVKLALPQLVNKFLMFYGTQSIFRVFIGVRHWTLF